MKGDWRWAAILCLLFCRSACGQPKSTLGRVQARGALLCGIDRAEPEYSNTDEHGNRAAFDRELCRAVAVAVLGPGARVIATDYADDVTSQEALAAGKVDVVATLTDDLLHSSALNGAVGFSAPVLQDGVALMVGRASGVRHAVDLGGKTVCFLSGSHAGEALQDWFALHRVDLLPFPFQEEGEMEAAFLTGNCAALAGDVTRLAQTRAGSGLPASDLLLLPERLAVDPLAMAYRRNDAEWAKIVNWTREVLVAGEELGVSAAGTAEAEGRGGLGMERLLGRTREVGRPLHLRESWAAEVLSVVGSYAGIYARTLGPKTPMALPRGENALVRDGGRLSARLLR